MAKTRAQLRSLVEDTTGRTDKSDLINNALQFAIEEMLQRYSWRNLATVQATNDSVLSIGDTSLTLTATTIRIREARGIDGTTSGWAIRVLMKEKFLREVPNIASITGDSKPEIGYQDGQTFHFAPGSDSTYTIRVTGDMLVTMDDDTDTNPIIMGDHALTCFATAFTFRALEQFESAASWDEQFEKAFIVARRNDTRMIAEVVKPDPHRTPDGLISGTPWLDPFVRSVEQYP